MADETTEKQGVFAALQTIVRRSLSQFRTFGGDRDVWESCGYPDEVGMEAMELRYQRFGLARQIVNAYPNYCWSKVPSVYETEDGEQTEFERRWKILADDNDLHMFAKLRAVDRLAGRGKCAVLLIGIDDGKALSTDATSDKPHNITFLRQYHPAKIVVTKTDTDQKSPRYGMPVMYRLGKDGKTSIEAHWTRILHVADNTDEKEWVGESRLVPVWNHILDIEKILGGGAEMFWKGAFPGIAFNMDKDSQPSPSDLTDIDTAIKEYFNGLNRYMKLQGIDAKTLKPGIADPSNHFKLQMQSISGATGLPWRILLGSEQAQYASAQDHDNWMEKVEARRVDFCESYILRPFISRLQAVGVLPQLSATTEETGRRITVSWPELIHTDPKAVAETSKVKSEAMSVYVGNPAMGMLMPPQAFMTDVMGFSEEQVESYESDIGDELTREKVEGLPYEDTEGSE